MEREIVEVKNNKFDYHGKTYDCTHLVERDKKVILREADDTHKHVLDELYDRNSLNALRCELYLDANGNIVYLLIIYGIKYKLGTDVRNACGDYYPKCEIKKGVLYPPRPYQGKICW